MAAPKNNQYWKQRSKHGRNKIIKSHEFLAKASDEYFQWCIDNPIIQIDYRGKDLIKVELPHPRVFKKEEFARFCGLSEWRLITDLTKDSKDFSQVITRIEKVIADQKYTYAVVGMFNSTIVSRDLGLADKIKSDVKVEFSNISDYELDEKIKRGNTDA